MDGLARSKHHNSIMLKSLSRMAMLSLCAKLYFRSVDQSHSRYGTELYLWGTRQIRVMRRYGTPH